MNIFRTKLEAELGSTTDTPGYAGVIAVVKSLADRHRGDTQALRDASERVLMSLFPSWLPRAFSVLFSRPFPAFAAWINAVVTVGVTQWLMGPSQLAPDGVTVEIERCRYLEGLLRCPSSLVKLPHVDEHVVPKLTAFSKSGLRSGNLLLPKPRLTRFTSMS